MIFLLNKLLIIHDVQTIEVLLFDTLKLNKSLLEIKMPCKTLDDKDQVDKNYVDKLLKRNHEEIAEWFMIF